MIGRIVIAVVIVLALVAGAAGIGVNAYNAGVARGLADSGEFARPEGAGGPDPYYGFRGPYFYPGRHFGYGFGPFGCLFPLLGLFLFFALLKGLVWRGPWGWGRHMRHGPWEKGLPPMFEEWHRKAHETPSQPAEKQG